MNKIVVEIDESADLDKLLTFIVEKCRQTGVKHTVKVDALNSVTSIEEQRKLYSSPIEVGEKVAFKILTARTKRFGFKECKTYRKIIEIESGFAFGDGTHPTTKMCVETIEKYIKQDATVLDIGCGSGILALTALALGAKEALGIDISPHAILNAQKNAELNHVADRLKVVEGNLTDSVTGKYDLIIANMLTDPIISLLNDIHGYMKSNGIIILSGIPYFRENEVMESAEKFSVIDRMTKDEWVCLVLQSVE